MSGGSRCLKEPRATSSTSGTLMHECAIDFGNILFHQEELKHARERREILIVFHRTMHAEADDIYRTTMKLIIITWYDDFVLPQLY